MKAPMRKHGENAASVRKQPGITPGSRLGALMTVKHAATVNGGSGLHLPSRGLWKRAQAGCRSEADMQ